MWTLALLLAMLAVDPPAPSDPAAARARDLAGATLYEVNVRQFSADGDFEGVRRQLPRLAELGVDVLWLMPIHPIGAERRKGTLGSYYAVQDFESVNPEYGSPDDFRRLVDEAHGLGLRVVLDWVANHTAWDHVWTATHPEWFTRGPDGGFVAPVDDWSDVVDLDYDQPGLRRAMTDALRHWVEEYDVDGFRCDVAEMVPRDFWEEALAELRAIKPLFLLAEGADPWLYEAGFDATYGWWIANALVDVAGGRRTPGDLRGEIERELALHAEHPGHHRVLFTSNHDWNSWHGLALERFGPAFELATVLSFTLPGMPLVYGGQEAGLDRQLAFFERDPIRWRRDGAASLYRALAALKRDEPALAHGPDAGEFRWGTLPESADERLLVFARLAADRAVLVLANPSGARVAVPAVEGRFAEATDLWGFPVDGPPSALEPWGWRVYRF